MSKREQAVQRAVWILFLFYQAHCTCAFLTFPDSHFGDFCPVPRSPPTLEDHNLELEVSPSWANSIFPWRWFGNTGFYQGVPSSFLAQSFVYLHLHSAQENCNETSSRSGLDKRIAFWCGFGQLLTWVIPSPCVICVELRASAYV